MLKFKSVYDPIEKSDGLRILATRFRGHGMKKDRYDEWMPNLGPSEKLLKDILKGTKTWKNFEREFKQELLSAINIDKRNRTILNHGQKFTLRLIKKLSEKQNVTLMCHCATMEEQCHLRVLEKVIKNI